MRSLRKAAAASRTIPARHAATALRASLTATFLLAAWALAAALVDRPMLPNPVTVIRTLGEETVRGTMPVHLGISVARALAALFFAFVPALILGVATGLCRSLDDALSPAAYVLAPVPKTALLPVILLFLGLGNASKIFLVALILFFPFYLAIRDETRGVDRSWFDSLYTLGGGRLAALFHVVGPAILPRLWSTARSSVGTALAVLFLAETFATREGIGWYIMDAWSRVEYPTMYSGIVALGLAGLALTGLMDTAERITCPWASDRA